MVDPVEYKASPAQTGTETIDQHKVDMALQTIRADIPINDSQLASALTNPRLNQAERNLIIQTLAREENGALPFYANDVSRTGDNASAELSADQRVIGQALQQAYEDGAINADDLLRIADANGAGNGAQRLLSTLQYGGGGVGGTVEALSDALWARNGGDGLDRAVAAIGYTSDPYIQARNLTTPEDRRAAFEALVAFNQAAPYDDIPAGATSEVWRNSALNASGRLFTANSSELIDYYTGANGTPAQTETLARFLSQTVLNPEAQGIWMNQRQDLVPAIRASLDSAAGGLLETARNAEPGSLEQERALAQFGRLTASVSGAAALALTEYSDQIQANQESREAFAGTVSDLVGLTKLGDVFGVDKGAEYLGGLIYDAITDNPERPDQALAGVLYDAYAAQVDGLATELNQAGLRSAFDAGFSAELLNLQQNLNVNLGGHEN